MRLQSRSFAHWNQSLRHIPNSIPALLRLSAIDLPKSFSRRSGEYANFCKAKAKEAKPFPFESPQWVKVLVTLIIFRLEIKLGFELSDKTPSAKLIYL